MGDQKNANAKGDRVDKRAYLARKVANLPKRPGVYKMLGKDGEILYIGKAKSLKRRVGSYFGKTHAHPKTQALVARVWDVETLLTRGETEALLLEQNLIKAHRPPYNILLRDDKSYAYIFVSKGAYARLGVGRGKKNRPSDRVFGPYPSAAGAKENALLVQRTFRLRSCADREFAQRKRPCLEYQIERCSAPCVGLIDKQAYQADVDAALRFLAGDVGSVKDVLTQKMRQCAEAMRFEAAAFYRDRLISLNEIAAKQAVFAESGDADAMAIAEAEGVFCVYVLTVRHGQVLGGRAFFVDDPDPDADRGERLARFVLSFYRDTDTAPPSEILLDTAIARPKAVAALLDAKTAIKCAAQGRRQQWLDIARLNAKNALDAKLGDYYRLQRRFDALQDALAAITSRVIDSIECFDISHTLGEATVGSCVVFDRMGPKKRDWRQYAVRDIQAGDDYAAMEQVLQRRYSKRPLPDLLLVDGGKGQLSRAKDLLLRLGILEDTLLVGIAKGEGRKAGLEVLHFVDADPIDLPADHEGLLLLMRARDEAHRFAVDAHRKKRDKARGSSVLERIAGLGPTRRRDLLSHFGGFSQLLGASEAQIAQVKGFGKTLASVVYKTLHE